MRIARFDLRAYGHFTSLSLELSPGLNILYGDNEAGKSTTLRALGQLLFGFPNVCSDGFLHPLPSLRVGALIEDNDGRQFACVRRKSRSDSLRGEDDVVVLPEGTLDKLLGGIERSRFESQFGINYEQLVAGGREICAGKGQLGEILFAAASGVSHLGKILRQLEAEANDIFNPRKGAKNPSLNDSLLKFAQVEKEIKKLQLPSRLWEEKVRGLELDRENLRQVQESVQTSAGQRENMLRLRQSLPLIARRESLVQEHADLATAPLLAEGFDDRRFKLQTDEIAAQTRRDELVEALAAGFRKLDEVAIPENLLQRAPRIRQLNQELGSILKAQRDRHRLEGQLNQLTAGIQTRLSELGRNGELTEKSSAAGQNLGVNRQQRARIQKLAKEGLGFVKDVQNRDERRREIERDVARTRHELEAAGTIATVDELRAALANVQSGGNLETQLAQKRAALENARRQADIELARLGLWNGPLEKLAQLPMPGIESINRFDSETFAAAAEVALARRQVQESQQSLDELGRRLERFRLDHDVPTEADLHEARARRDEAWKLVRERLSSGTDPGTGAASMADAYQQSVARADEVADRLRREAELVAQKAQLLSDQDRLRESHRALQAGLVRLESRIADIDREWKGLWQQAQVDPLPPQEMRAWLNRWAQLVARVEAVHEQTVEVERLDGEVSGHASRLRHCLAEQGLNLEEGPVLAELTALAVDCVKRADDAARVRSQREELLRERIGELGDAGRLTQAAVDAVTAWRAEWAGSMQVLSLSGEASIEEATAVLETIDDIIAQQSKARDLAERIEGIDSEADEFQAAQATLLDIAPELRELTAEQSIAQLVARLDAVEKDQARRQDLAAQQSERESALVEAEATLKRCQAGLAVLCREAGCESADALSAAERRSRERQRVEKELAGVNAQLAELAGGKKLDELIDEAKACDPDQLGSRIAELELELSALSQTRDEQLTARGAKEAELAQMDGSSRAADRQTDAEALLAQIRSDAERYVRLKLATSVLRETMEQFRQKNQGPILALASQSFARLTLGSFCGLRVELNDRGEPVLWGVRSGATTVPLDGMSDGTSDQLFLALRIASLEHYFRDHPPIPFVVDDILIKFDDDRAVAALEALHELAQHTQVVMFTHHRHLLDLATKRLPPEACTVSHVALPAAP